METLSYLAPIAFVFALSALAQSSRLRRELEELRGQVEELQGKL